MYVARVLYPVEVLGPGKRVGIWFCGCPHKCKGCSNPELWDFSEKYRTTPNDIFNIVTTLAKNNPVDGFTITGGDPMYQAQSLQQLLVLLKQISNDIIVYTGYTINQLDPKYLQNVTVLIDGKYVEDKNDNTLLRGSSNQNVYVLDKSQQQKYTHYFNTASNQIQNFFTYDGVVSVGIHKPDFNK